MKNHLFIAIPVVLSIASWQIAKVDATAPASRAVATRAASSLPPKKGAPWIPLEITDEERLKAHKEFVQRSQNSNADILFLGDDMIAGFGGVEKIQKKYASEHALFFGIKNTLIENLLWRINDGELGKLEPKVVVLGIGTVNATSFRFADPNNVLISDDNHVLVMKGEIETREARAKGIQTVVETIQKKLPHAKIIILGLVPRVSNGSVADDDASWRGKNESNQLISKLDNGSTIRYIDLSSAFIDDKGNALDDNYEAKGRSRMPTQGAFERCDELISPVVSKMMGQ